MCILVVKAGGRRIVGGGERRRAAVGSAEGGGGRQREPRPDRRVGEAEQPRREQHDQDGEQELAGWRGAR